MLWRLAANHTHLYAGALLRKLEEPDARRWSPGDEVLVEFSDGATASAQLLEADDDAVELRMPTYCTQQGTSVVARTWRLVPTSEPGVLRVQKRLPAS